VNSAPRRRLRDILGQHGLELVGDPRRTKALLMDLSGEHKLEINLLNAAQEERVAADLLKMPKGTPKTMLFDQLVRRLQENRGLALEPARWAVESWALALGVGVPSDFGKRATAPPTHPAAPPPPVSGAAPRPVTAAGPAPQPSAYPLADLGLGGMLMSALQFVLTAGPRALNMGRRVLRVVQIIRLTTRSLGTFKREDLPRAVVRLLGSAAVGALLWSVGGAGGGAVFGFFTMAFEGGGRDALIAGVIDWLAMGAVVGAMLGALAGMSIGVIRYYGEVGGTLIGAATGLALGCLLSLQGGSAFLWTGALTAGMFAVVSIAMISGQGRNVLLLTWGANGMGGTCLRQSAGWKSIAKAAFWGALGSILIALPLNIFRLGDLSLAAAAGWGVGMVSGALIGDKYKMLKYL
jgi:hypothetical protein